MKAIDFSSALGAPDPAIALQRLTEAFNFERDILEKCKQKNLDRVVVAISDGKVNVELGNLLGTVQYLIFKRADGDVRKHLIQSRKFELAWILRSLHHIATGLQQIHTQGIAHQDLKPSNVLVFDKDTSKISDLGSAVYKGNHSPNDDYLMTGDPKYAPPELLYKYVDPVWTKRRMGCDMYHFGSMICFFFHQPRSNLSEVRC